MTASQVRLQAATLADFVAAIFTARGMRADDAATVAEVLVWADLRGVGSHGVSRVTRYLSFIDRGHLDPTAAPVLTVDAGATFAIDGRRCAGAVAMKRGNWEAGARARAHGVSFGVIANTTHVGAIGYYAQLLAEQGLAAIVFAAGAPLMAVHGSRVASVGTNPIAIAIPALPAPLLLDMATSAVANGRLQQARDAGGAIAGDWALSADGEPTTDPNLAEILLPLGGAKGSGLALMFECMASLLGANPIVSRQAGPGGKRRHTANASLFAVDIARFQPLADYQQEVANLVAKLKALPSGAGVEGILLPGERGTREATDRARDGVLISARTWAKLGEVGRDLAVAIPVIQDAQ